MTAVHETAPSEVAVRQGSSPTAWKVALAIAQVEGARLLRHPATAIGLLISTVVTAIVFADTVPVLGRDVVTLAINALPLAGGVLVGGHLAASRLERDDVLPLACTASSTATARTTGLLLALLAPVALTGLWTALALLLMLPGSIGTPAVGDLPAPAATVLLAGALGVALGRWRPHVLTGVLALPVLGLVVVVAYSMGTGSTIERLVPVADWFHPHEMIEFWPRAPWMHLGYVLLLAGAAAGTALVRDRRTILVAAATIACVAGAVVTAAQLRAVWDDPQLVAAVARDLSAPDHRLICDQQRIRVCVPRGYDVWRERLRAPALDALAQVPAAARPRHLQMELQVSSDLPWTMPERVREALPADARAGFDQWPWAPEMPHQRARGVVPVLFLQRRGAAGATQRLDLSLGVLAEATGFGDTVRERSRAMFGDDPGDTGTDEGQLDVSDGCAAQPQAREVLTFALAALSDPGARDALEAELDARPYGWRDGVVDDWLQLPDGAATGAAASHGATGVGFTGLWGRGAATLGLALADRVDAEDLHARWDHWTDPATGATELVAEFGVPSLRSPVELANAAGVDIEGMEYPCADE